MKKLFTPLKMGKLQLSNRVVMAPMTRSRAPGNVANAIMAQYYADRSDAGLLITEGTSPSPNGLGYARIPGLYSREQVDGWKLVTSAVKKKGGHIFVQLMHTGRVSHPHNLPAGARILAPSAIGLTEKMWTDQAGMQPFPAPEAMSKADIDATIAEFKKSAELAVEAGFDGIELHSANGYLLEQFLNPAANTRSDSYGGNAENRMRFVLEVAEACTRAIGGESVGIRLSPHGIFNQMQGEFPGLEDFYGQLAAKLSSLGLVYLHVVDHSAMGAPPVANSTKMRLRKEFKQAYMLSGGYDADRAEADLNAGLGELVAFGRPFIGNPNLVEKLQRGASLRPADPNTFYSAGPEGYSDYPRD